jgi:hypothetical protein
VAYRLVLADEVREWLHALRRTDRATSRQVVDAVQTLLDVGPDLGRPLVDRVKGSRVHNLKELRPGSAGGTEVRILFVFDPHRNAVLLVAGDKAGQWQSWYRTAIKRAEDVYAQYLKEKKR